MSCLKEGQGVDWSTVSLADGNDEKCLLWNPVLCGLPASGRTSFPHNQESWVMRLSTQDSAVLHSCLTRKASKECVGHTSYKWQQMWCQILHIKAYKGVLINTLYKQWIKWLWDVKVTSDDEPTQNYHTALQFPFTLSNDLAPFGQKLSLFSNLTF